MLDNQTLEQLRRLRLSGMAAAFAQQLEQPELQALSFEERFSLLLDRELNLREEPPSQSPATTGAPAPVSLCRRHRLLSSPRPRALSDGGADHL